MSAPEDGAALVDRILERCIRVAPRPDQTVGCLEWQGASAKPKGGRPGHGRIKHKGKLLLPHRVILESEIGELPRHILACHECDNPPCCEVTHLFAGTYSDNAKDAAQKGRMFRPAPNGEAVRARNNRRWAEWREERGLPAEPKLKPLVKAPLATSKRMVEWDGETMTCAELGRRVGLSRNEISRLARKGWFAISNDNASGCDKKSG